MREAAVALASSGMIALVQGRLLQAVDYFSQAVQRYRPMQLGGEPGTALSGLALIQSAAGHAAAARESLYEAVQFAEKTRSMNVLLTGLPAMIHYFARCGPPDMALFLHLMIQQITMQANSRWYADVIGNEMEAKWQVLSPAQQETIDATVKGHTPFTVIPEVLACLE